MGEWARGGGMGVGVEKVNITSATYSSGQPSHSKSNHLMLNDVLVLHEYTQELINADILAALVLWPFITVAIQPTQLHGTHVPQLTSVRSLVS